MMKNIKTLISVTLSAAALGLVASPAHAIGCLSGAAGGAVAGHIAGHHAVIGAIGGCFVGHELAVKKKEGIEADKLIADYDTAQNEPARQAKDAVGIEKLAHKKVPVAVKWEQEHTPVK
jgi:hypothetical protein